MTTKCLRSLRDDTRGASMVEYVLILSLVLVALSPSVRSLGATVTQAFRTTVASFGP